jgi:hypothetical protein|tara:strand:+ start:113 stop:601 length:489 start_codon:yes stop_codon:yes gene_type:complete
MIKKQILNYIKNVLEVPRDEYDGLSACPFVKKERENNNIYIKNLDNNDGFISLMDEFYKSGEDNAIFIVEGEIPNSNTKTYQDDLNKRLLLNAYINHTALCINPKDEFEVDGLNVRSQAPCFLILINNQKEINTAHERMLKTKYFDKMSIKYKEFLGIKNMV